MTDYDVNTPDVIPGGIPLPTAVIKAIEARGKTYDAYGDKVIEYSDVLDDGAVDRAAKRDQAAARAAVLAGESLADLPSEVDQVRKFQPIARGVVQALHEQVRAADKAIYRAWSASLPDVADTVDELRDAAEREFRAAETAYKAALGRFRDLVQTTAYVRLQRAGKVRTLEAAPRYTMSPRLHESESQLSRHWLLAHGVPSDEPEIPQEVAGGTEPVRVRSLVNGAELMADPGNAAYMVASGDAEYVSAEA
ncbi:hypothetical protein [Streptomyces sp. NPDC005231]|uniref:hypothetical protein n=1 Tax=Streptomyces sp. NPDC005231 TaxID=3157026 RepID=UPI0033AEDB6D